MDAREEFERIKGNTKDLRKVMVEKGQYPTMNERDLKDLCLNMIYYIVQ